MQFLVKWPDIIRVMEEYAPKVRITKVLWEVPPEEWMKYNTDGASRETPGRNAYAYVSRTLWGT